MPLALHAAQLAMVHSSVKSSKVGNVVVPPEVVPLAVQLFPERVYPELHEVHTAEFVDDVQHSSHPVGQATGAHPEFRRYPDKADLQIYPESHDTVNRHPVMEDVVDKKTELELQDEEVHEILAQLVAAFASSANPNTPTAHKPKILNIFFMGCPLVS